MGFAGWLTLAFIVLKLTNYIDWNWLWVISPIPIVLLIIIALKLVEVLIEEL